MRNLRSQRYGVTLIELLVALSICMILALASSFGFVEAMRARDDAQRRLEATANGRHALDSVGLEFKRARLFPTTAVGTTTNPLYLVPFRMSRVNLATGNNRDQDLDTNLDEELSLDGADNDGDYASAIHDNHAAIPYFGGAGRVFERPLFGLQPDLGDFRVDEDTRFARTEIQFETFPISGGPPRRAVRFYLSDDPDDLQGGPYNLYRQVIEFNPGTGELTSSTGVLASNVLSFAILAYDQTTTPPSNPWQVTWDSDGRLATRDIYPEVPVSAYLAVEIFSGGPRSIAELASDEKIPSVVLSTVVNVEAVLADPRTTLLRPAGIPIVP